MFYQVYKNRYIVGLQRTVVGDQGKAFRNCLCEEHLIEWITMAWGQSRRRFSMG